MKFVSTGGQSPAADLRAALTAGLAPDGGLYLPERIDPIDASLLAELNGQSFSAVSRTVAGHLLGSLIPAADLDRIVDTALNFEVPLVAQGDDVHLLELFHGPTLAFKDVGARFMAQLLGYLGTEGGDPLTILAATSGDTGSAVAQAFLGVPGLGTVILFPKGKVTDLQERQFTTLGGNV
ncbi:MAG: threonine synthase, partial [Gemmatimonadota bacterium]|nr:threonine synthase [Gemmatimonadota bacterium]